MAAEIDPKLSPAAQKFIEETTMKSLLDISDQALDAVMALAYQLYQAGRYQEAEVLCRGLVAADHTYWWSYSLFAATLRRLGKLREALDALEAGLVYEPHQPKLLFMRTEITAAFEAQKHVAPAAHATSPANPPQV